MEVHTASVQVPDERVDRMTAMYKPKKTTYAQVHYKDIAGLAKGLGESGGLAGPLLNEMSQNDALLHVVRAFEDANVLHPEGGVDPLRDVSLVEIELMLSDMIVISKRLERVHERVGKGGRPLEVEALKEEQALLERLMTSLEAEHAVARKSTFHPKIEKFLRGFNLLSQKPMLVVLNTGDEADEGITASDSTKAASGYHCPARQARGRAGADGPCRCGRFPGRVWHRRARLEPASFTFPTSC